MSAWFVSRDLARRDVALDALRGLMVLGMILVNHPPPGAPVYPPLAHAAWHGWTLADTVQPGFLFAVGVAIGLVMVGADGLPPKPDSALYAKLVRRFALLMGLNLLLINFPYYFAGTIRFTGTLALIAWCYLIVAAIHLHAGWRAQSVMIAGALLTQWAVLAWLPVPGVGAGALTPEGNAASYLDRVWRTPFFGAPPSDDGEGITAVGLLAGVSITLNGLLAGRWMRSPLHWKARIGGAFAVGVGLFLLGNAWHMLLPVNKRLWTPSYAVLTSGMALMLLAALTWITERSGRQAWIEPLRIAGTNALFLYVFAQSLQRLLVYGRLRGDDGAVVRLRSFAYEHYFAPWVSGELGSLLFALVFLAICYLPVLLLYRSRFFLKL